jgi:hypothetical protein
MRFVTGLALAITALVLLPWLAHRLRRRRAEERPFAAARLVPPAPPRARRRSQLEDRALFGMRAASILALAVLGASPLVRCSRLSLHRDGGASVALAIVLDDSMSMRARVQPGAGPTRIERALRGARELLASSREGDAVALVLAGAPSRVALAATTDLAAARAAIDAVTPSDRATDLDGAISMARALVAQLPQVDKRIVVLSDLADGRPEAPPVGDGAGLPVWVALPELRGDAPDCGVVMAEQAGAHLRVTLACGHGATTTGRNLTVRKRESPDEIVATTPAPAAAGGQVEIATGDVQGELMVRLEGEDAIAQDDSAVAVPELAAPAIAVVADPTKDTVATGGAPVVEQAFAALAVDVAARPMPALPDRVEDLAPFIGVLADDPSGFTPEQRRALTAFVEQGGSALVALGPRAAAAPLGASLEPVVPHAVAWSPTTSKGASESTAAPAFGEAAGSLGDLGARARAVLTPDDLRAFDPLVMWEDGMPLFARRAQGRGAAWITTLPFSVDASDLTLRPGFLSLLAAWLDDARARAVPRRTDVGTPWTFASARDVTVTGPEGALPVTRDGASARVVPALIGAYHVVVAGKAQTRVAAPLPAEMDLRPRAASPSAQSESLGEARASVDVSWWVALLLLGLVAAELALRVARARAPEPA